MELFATALEVYKADEIFDQLVDNGDPFPLLNAMENDEVSSCVSVILIVTLMRKFSLSLSLSSSRPLPISDVSLCLVIIIISSKPLSLLSVSHHFSLSLITSHCLSSLLSVSHDFSLSLITSLCLSSLLCVSHHFSLSLITSLCLSSLLFVCLPAHLAVPCLCSGDGRRVLQVSHPLLIATLFFSFFCRFNLILSPIYNCSICV